MLTNIKAKWVNGNLIFTDAAGTTLLTIDAAGNVDIVSLQLNNVAVMSTAAEINALHGVTAGTVAASSALVSDAASGIAGLVLNGLVVGKATHDYAGAAVAWALSAAEQKAARVIVTNANGAVDATATPTDGKVYLILNTSGQALTFKATGQTGVTIASTKSAIVIGNGTDFVRVTADA